MINLYNQVPSVYTSASRDFQYLGWLIDIVLNSIKHNVDDLYDLPNTKADPKLTELLAMTLGFKLRRNYDQKQLTALVGAIPSILKYKGTMQAVVSAGKALLNASGSTGIFECWMEDYCLIILLPADLVDTTLFIDLLPYILPAGLTYRIVRKTASKEPIDPIKVKYSDRNIAKWYADINFVKTEDTQYQFTGLSELYNPLSNDAPTFTNYDNAVLNTGMFDNAIIPTFYTKQAEAVAVTDATHDEAVAKVQEEVKEEVNEQ